MPTPFVQYGWRVYTNKVCSYKGLEAECPTLQHYNDHPSFNEFFWDTLFPGGCQWVCLAASYVPRVTCILQLRKRTEHHGCSNLTALCTRSCVRGGEGRSSASGATRTRTCVCARTRSMLRHVDWPLHLRESSRFKPNMASTTGLTPTLNLVNPEPQPRPCICCLLTGRKPDGSFCTSASGCCSKNCADGKCEWAAASTNACSRKQLQTATACPMKLA